VLAFSRAAAGAVEPGGALRNDVWERLETIADPRSPRGRVYPLPCLVGMAVCALTAAGHDHLCAVGQWAARASQDDLARLRVPADPLTGIRPTPDESTVRRLLARLDPRALAGALLGPRPPAPSRPGAGPAPAGGSRHARPAGPDAVAVDGKTSRGARRRDGSRVHLLGVVDHDGGHLVDHVEVDQKTNETTAFQPLLAPLCLAGVTVTFDALHAVRANMDWLVREKKAHYLAVIKKNQPVLHERLRTLPWAEVPTGERTRDHGHGRDETRTVKAATVAGLDFPHARQAIKITRWRRETGRPATRETVYAVTDLAAEAAGPAELGCLARRHWHVEDKVHYVRDVSFGEDASTVRPGHAPANWRVPAFVDSDLQVRCLRKWEPSTSSCDGCP
jgi:predicted transposase YbfD/YdcC